jgi:hypothetical protein
MSTLSNTEVSDGVDDEDLIAALRTLATATRDVEAAKLAIATAKDELAVALFLAARPHRTGAAPLPLEFLRALYWERPEVRVRDLARAFGLRLGELTDLVGPRREPGTCADCESRTEVTRRSRTHRPTARCPPCEEERLHRDRLRREREQHEQWVSMEAERHRWDDGNIGIMPWMYPDESP